MFRALVFCASLLAFSHSATAQEDRPVDLIGGLSVGYSRLHFPAKLDSTPTFPSYVISGSASYRNLYASLSYADSFTRETISEEEDTGEASRNDLDLTVGYHLGPALTIYAGYKDSETDIDFRLRDSDRVRDEYYRLDGLFVGANYSFDLDSAGSLTLNLGYSDLNSRNRFLQDECLPDDEDCDEEEEEEDGSEFDDLTGRHKGKADGWSYGVSWLIPLSNNLAFNSTIKVNDYREEIKFEGQRYSADQKITFFNIGVVYIF